MDFLISSAFAQGTAPAPVPGPFGGGLGSFLPLIIIFAIFYFIMIRPQMKRQKEHRAMIDALAKGDEVITAGGVVGRIEELSDSFITLEIADKVSIKVQRNAISAVLPKGTIKQS